MGFLDRFLKAEDKEKIKATLQSAKEMAEEKAKQFAENQAQAREASRKAEEPAPKKTYAPVIDSSISDTASPEYFEDLILKNLPGIEVRKNVAPVDFADPKKYVNMDLLLLKDGSPVLAIIICPKNVYKRYAIVNTMADCKARGFKAIRFMKEFSNNGDYVIDRIKTEANI